MEVKVEIDIKPCENKLVVLRFIIPKIDFDQKIQINSLEDVQVPGVAIGQFAGLYLHVSFYKQRGNLMKFKVIFFTFKKKFIYLLKHFIISIKNQKLEVFKGA